MPYLKKTILTVTVLCIAGTLVLSTSSIAGENQFQKKTDELLNDPARLEIANRKSIQGCIDSADIMQGKREVADNDFGFLSCNLWIAGFIIGFNAGASPTVRGSICFPKNTSTLDLTKETVITLRDLLVDLHDKMSFEVLVPGAMTVAFPCD